VDSGNCAFACGAPEAGSGSSVVKPAPAPELSRRRAGVVFDPAGEVVDGPEARAGGDLADRQAGACQQLEAGRHALLPEVATGVVPSSARKRRTRWAGVTCAAAAIVRRSTSASGSRSWMKPRARNGLSAVAAKYKGLEVAAVLEPRRRGLHRGPRPAPLAREPQSDPLTARVRRALLQRALPRPTGATSRSTPATSARAPHPRPWEDAPRVRAAAIHTQSPATSAPWSRAAVIVSPLHARQRRPPRSAHNRFRATCGRRRRR
jgi:hypothetical protein